MPNTVDRYIWNRTDDTKGFRVGSQTAPAGDFQRVFDGIACVVDLARVPQVRQLETTFLPTTHRTSDAELRMQSIEEESCGRLLKKKKNLEQTKLMEGKLGKSAFRFILCDKLLKDGITIRYVMLYKHKR